jgi:hypothetical protein
MIIDLELKIESIKPLAFAKKEKWETIVKVRNFETASATIIFLSEILELYDNCTSNFKLIHWAGPNMI